MKKQNDNLGKNSNSSDAIMQQYPNNCCVVCSKTFGSMNKLVEHINSKTHKLKSQKYEESKGKLKVDNTNNSNDNNNLNTVPETNSKCNVDIIVEKKEERKLTAENNYKICFVCNNYQANEIPDLLTHLKQSHNFEFPVQSCLKSPLKAIKLCIKKIFTFGTCLYCDSQRFQSARSVQTHMRDTHHVKINFEDIIEYFYKFYDKKNFLEKATEEEKQTKEFKLLKRILIPKKNKNEVKGTEKEIEEIEEVEEIDENMIIEENDDTMAQKVDNINDYESDLSDDLKDINYVKMENGELMLKDGKILGNKIYSTYYKQRVKIGQDWKDNNHALKLRMKAKAFHRKNNEMKDKKNTFCYWKISGSKKSNFERINSFHHVTKTG